MRTRRLVPSVVALAAAVLLAGCASCDCEAETDAVVGWLGSSHLVAEVEVVTVEELSTSSIGRRHVTVLVVDELWSAPTGFWWGDWIAFPALADGPVVLVEHGDRARLALGDRAVVVVSRHDHFPDEQRLDGFGQLRVALPDGELPGRRDDPEELVLRTLRSALDLDGGTPSEQLVALTVEARRATRARLEPEAGHGDPRPTGLLERAMADAGLEGAPAPPLS